MHQINWNRVVFTVGFCRLPLPVMLAVTKLSKLIIEEMDLFLAIVEWPSYQQNQFNEDDIKSVFKQIQYPLVW